LGRLGQYRVLKLLGQGGMGMVFQAEDSQLRRLAALKVMRPEFTAHDQARARFLREARAAAALKHDHIVTIYQVGEEGGVPFLAMEFLGGKSLEEWLRPDRRASIPETLTIAKQIARGLAAAHSAGLIHRDVKPANIWLEAPRGRVKLLDFGLARLAAGEFTALTQDGAVLGTPAFMAPEQARGEAVDARCDLFSFGCVLYRMVTGRLPFQGNTVYAVLAAVASETPPAVRSLNPGVPPRLAGLIDRLLAKSPAARPASAQEVLKDLQEIEKNLPPTTGPTEPWVGPGAAAAEMPARFHRRSWVAAALGLAILSAVVFLALWWPGRKDAPAPERTQTPDPGPNLSRPAPAPPADKVDPVGTWKCEYEAAGQMRTCNLTIKKNGDKLAGTMSWPDQKETNLKDLKLKDGTLTFSALRKYMGNDVTVEYKLTIDGDQFKGKGTTFLDGIKKQEFDIEGEREKKDK
jgi:tRNA A-37 threonylcarbamoyl transferase component Bud32